MIYHIRGEHDAVNIIYVLDGRQLNMNLKQNRIRFRWHAVEYELKKNPTV